MVNNKPGKISFKIKEHSFLGRLAAWKLKTNTVAIVIGKTIHLHNTGRSEFLRNKRWVLHELKHIEQFKQHGFFSFIFLYLWESLRHGYTNNKYEIEARAAETDEEFLKTLDTETQNQFLV
ncbi:MAG: DUF4157 domain-containing protein [Chitinophagaceae bacterium]